MTNTWAGLSDQIATAVEHASSSVVQVQGHRRPAAGVVFADGLILTPATPDDDRVTIHAGDATPVEGVALGRVSNMGLTVVHAEGLGRHPLQAAAEPRVGSLAVAIGRTWSGNIMATLAPISVVGGPLRTGRASSLERVIRIQQSPHGALVGGALIDASGQALGIVTSMAIRGTTVVIPAVPAWAAGSRVKAEGGTRQGFLGVSSLAVELPARQKAGRVAGLRAARQPCRVGESGRSRGRAGRRPHRRVRRRNHPGAGSAGDAAPRKQAGKGRPAHRGARYGIS